MNDDSWVLNRRGFLVTAGGAAVAVASPKARAAPPVVAAAPAVRKIGHVDPAGKFGALLNRAEFDNAPHALKAELVASLTETHPNLKKAITTAATKFTLSNLPPISMQGTDGSLGFPGSCEAQSFGYCLGTFTGANPGGPPAQGFDPNPLANRISAAWLFAWLTHKGNLTGCGGSAALDYLELLVSTGAPSEAQVPYKPDCAYLTAKSASNPSGIDVDISHYSGVGKFKIASYYALPNFLNGQATYLSTFKSYLRGGNAIAFSGLVPPSIAKPEPDMVKGAYDPKHFIPNSGHGQVIVGYDDSLGHTGAFLIQNSFGTEWPYLPGMSSTFMQGRLYWTYEAFFASQGYGAIAFPLTPHIRLPKAVAMVPVNTGDPELLVNEASLASDPATGDHFALFQLSFAAAVRVTSITVKGPGNAAPITQRINATMQRGHSHVTQRTPFAPGTYQVTVTGQVNGHAASYTGNVAVK